VSLDYLASRVDLSHPDAASVYDELPLWSAMFGLALLERIELRRGIQVLDVGSGTGFPLLELAQRLGRTCTVYGIDPWQAAVGRARLKARAWGVRNVGLVRGDAAAMPFPDARFDLAVSNLGLNNFGRPERVLAECRRVLKPSGRLVFTTNLRGHAREFYEAFAATLVEVGHGDALDALRRHVEHRATVDGIAALLGRAGFRLSKLHEESASMRFVDGSALLRHHFIRLGFLDAWRRVVDARREADVFSRLEANLNRLAEGGPLRLTVPVAYLEAEPLPPR
jgi:arsenite methyltransferase